jgi:glycosyltransferase involved in cell wall biosynthesis
MPSGNQAPKTLFVTRKFYPASLPEVDIYLNFLRQKNFDVVLLVLNSTVERPDVIGCNSRSKILFLQELKLVYCLVKMLLSPSQRPRYLYIYDSFLLGFIPLCVARVVSVKTVVDVRTTQIVVSNFKRDFLNFLQRLGLHAANSIVTINLGLIELLGGGPEVYRKSVELPSGFSDRLVKVRTMEIKDGTRFVLPTTLHNTRNLEVVFEAFAAMPSRHLFVFTRDSLTSGLPQRFCHFGNIHFHEYVPHDRMMQVLSEYDYGIAIIPKTPYFEYQPPLKTVEYLAAGLPVLATDTSGNKVYVNETNGVFVDQDVESVKNGIVRITERTFDPQKVRQSVAKFEWDDMLERCFNVVFAQDPGTGGLAKGKPATSENRDV